MEPVELTEAIRDGRLGFAEASCSVDTVLALISQVNINGDGTITYIEFIKALRSSTATSIATKHVAPPSSFTEGGVKWSVDHKVELGESEKSKSTEADASNTRANNENLPTIPVSIESENQETGTVRRLWGRLRNNIRKKPASAARKDSVATVLENPDAGWINVPNLNDEKEFSFLGAPKSPTAISIATKQVAPPSPFTEGGVKWSGDHKVELGEREKSKSTEEDALSTQTKSVILPTIPATSESENQETGTVRRLWGWLRNNVRSIPPSVARKDSVATVSENLDAEGWTDVRNLIDENESSSTNARKSRNSFFSMIVGEAKKTVNENSEADVRPLRRSFSGYMLSFSSEKKKSPKPKPKPTKTSNKGHFFSCACAREDTI